MENYELCLVPSAKPGGSHLLRLVVSPEEAARIDQKAFEAILDRGIATLNKAKLQSRKNPAFRKEILNVHQLN